MELQKSSQEFFSFLLDCTSRDTLVKGSAFTYEVTNGAEVVHLAAVVLPPSTLSPLSDFIGPVQCPTVVFASRESPEELGEDSPELRPVLTHFSDSLLKEEQEKTEESSHQLRCSIHLIPQETVSVGQQLLSKRVFLNRAVDFHSGQSKGSTTVLHADLSTLTPVSVDVARMLCSLYSIASRKASTPLPALWVPCTDDSKQDIVSLGCSFDHSSSQLQIYSIKQEEVIETGDQKAGKGSGGRQKHLNSHDTVFAEYDIASCASDSTLGQMISLQLVWEGSEKFLCPPPLGGTEAVLHIVIEPGSLQSMYVMYDELQTLLKLCKAVSEGKEWFQESEEVLKSEDSSLASKVEAFLQDVNSPLSHMLQINVVSPTIEGTIYKARENFDFTEQLWLFMKDVANAEDVQQALSSIFKSLLLGKVQNIALRDSSVSSLAELLRQLIKCTSPVERQALAPKFQLLLSSRKTLQFLAQMGCEKLKRDVKGFLVGTNVATGSQCDAFFQGIGCTVIEECQSLCNLYHVVELAATLLSFRSFPTPILASLVKAAMEVYKHKQFKCFQATPRFSLPISGKVVSLIEMCSNIAPKMWSLSSRSSSSITVVRDRPLLSSRACAESNHYVYNCTCNQIPWK